MGPHYQRGDLLFDMKRYREAAEAFQCALADDPNAAFVHAMLGASLLNCGRNKDAERAIQRALELEPDMAYAHYVRSFLAVRRQSWGEAERAIAESVRLEQTPHAFHQWGVISRDRGKFEEAMAATGRALELNPQYSPAIILRGELLAKAGRLEESHALFAMALACNPEDAKAQHALGALRLKTGDARAALGMLREARRLDPLGANDAEAISLAYGRMLWPLRIVDRMIWRSWQRRPKLRWLMFTLLGALFVALVLASGLHTAGDQDINVPLTVFFVALANYVVLPLTFDQFASTVGSFFLRREFGRPWYTLLVKPIILWPLAWAHAGATALGVLAAMQPTVGLIACIGAAYFPLLAESIQIGPSRATGYICLPLYVVVMIAGTLFALLIELDNAPLGVAVVAALFAVGYFADSFARGVSGWRLRQSPLLNETWR